jgi:hypothetical protein
MEPVDTLNKELGASLLDAEPFWLEAFRAIQRERRSVARFGPNGHDVAE